MSDHRKCKTCVYWKKDFGTWCMNGWTGMNDPHGHCHLEPKVVAKDEDDLCRHWESKYPVKDEVSV